MDRSIFIGDRVRTKWGDGIVHDARSWRETIIDMDDWEAREFSDQCRQDAGENYMTGWVELLVVVKGVRRRVLGHHVEVLKGRFNE